MCCWYYSHSFTQPLWTPELADIRAADPALGVVGRRRGQAFAPRLERQPRRLGALLCRAPLLRTAIVLGRTTRARTRVLLTQSGAQHVFPMPKLLLLVLHVITTPDFAEPPGPES